MTSKKKTDDDPMDLDEFLELSGKEKLKKWEAERLAKAETYQKLIIELDRVMPEVKLTYGVTGTYQCRICGGLVLDRLLHLRWHRGSEMLDVLEGLFGRGFY